MGDGFQICSLIENGGLFYDVEGSSPQEVYKNVVENFTLPDYLNKEELLEELLTREKILSTAVGSGIAIPHPRRPMMQNDQDQKIFVCFLKNSLDMNAPDARKVFVMFFVLSSSSKTHLDVLSSLAKAIKYTEFKQILQTRPSAKDLIEAFKKYSK